MGSFLEEIINDNTKYFHRVQMHQRMNKRLQRNALPSFHHKSEYCAFQCGSLPNREELLGKKRAKNIVLHGNNRVSVAFIQKYKLSVNITTSVNVDETFNNFQLLDDKESLVEFTVPSECFKIRLQLEGEVKNITNKNEINVNKSQVCVPRNISKFHLIPQANNKHIILLSPFIPNEIDYKYENKYSGLIMIFYDKYLSTKYKRNLKYENVYIIIDGQAEGSYDIFIIAHMYECHFNLFFFV